MASTLPDRLRLLLRGLREPGSGEEAEGRVVVAFRQAEGQDGRREDRAEKFVSHPGGNGRDDR